MTIVPVRQTAQAVMVSLGLAWAMPIPAQISDPQDTMSATEPLRPQTPASSPDGAGQIAESAVGVVGQRQTRGQVIANVPPMARINNRIENRIQNRIRNRIDRDYDLQASTISPFALAEEQGRTSSGRLR